MKSYPAPWSKSLIVTSILVVLLCLALACLLPLSFSKEAISLPFNRLWVPIALLLIPAGCLPFWIRGYSVTDDAIRIHRLFATKVLPRDGLKSAEVLPHIMRGSIRLCGIGGVFSFTGFFWNRKLRTYRAYVSDPSLAVVLKFTNRPVVISPGDPSAFVRDLGLVQVGDSD